jgi:hypothetical protein
MKGLERFLSCGEKEEVSEVALRGSRGLSNAALSRRLGFSDAAVKRGYDAAV